MQRWLIRSVSWFLVLVMFASPVLAAAPGGFSLLGVDASSAPESAPLGISTPKSPSLGYSPAPRAAESPRATPDKGLWNWGKKFTAGAWDGFIHAIPNLVRSFRQAPLTTTLMLGGAIGLGIVWPPGALIAAGGMMGHSIRQAGTDPTKLGVLVGETGFWVGTGAAAARGLRALRGKADVAKTAAADSAAAAESAALKEAELVARFKDQTRTSLPEWNGPGQMPYRGSFRQILSTFEEPVKSARLMQSLEAEVMELAARRKILPQEALEQVLRRGEQAGGFKPAVKLEPRAYTDAEFHDMLQKGSLFQDPTFLNKAHGVQTHRIQWNLVMRDMELNPKAYALPDGSMPRPVDLFTTMGTDSFTASVQGKTVWGTLFDSFNSNFTQPEFVKPAIDSIWKGVGTW